MILERKKENIKIEDIMSKLTQFDIFRFYIPGLESLNTSVPSPLHMDKNPSMSVGTTKGGRLQFNDYSADVRGGPVDLVMMLYGINYDKALHKIASDFGIDNSESVEYKKIVAKYVQPIIDPKRHCEIHVFVRKFNDKELQYWAQYGITIEELKREDIWACKEWSLNRGKQYIAPDELCFVYKFPSGFKIYYPNRPKAEKWISNVSCATVEGLGCLNDQLIVIITKSRKDRVCLKKVLKDSPICILNSQNESSAFVTDVLREKLTGKKVYTWFDTDPAGKKNSRKITLEICKNWLHLNVPDFLYEKHGVKDVSDWYKLDGNDNRIREFLKLKKIIE